MEGEKNTRGGKRPGAGRPKGTTRGITRHYKKVNLAFLEEDYEMMRSLADASGKTLSRYIVDVVLGKRGKDKL